jgi:hypothetical protein
MKRRDILATFAGAAVPGSAQTYSFALQFRDSFMKHWDVERGYTLAVAEAMPAEHYNFKPNPVQRSFGEQLIHLATANTAYFSAFGLIPMPERVTAADKETVPKYPNSSWDYTVQVLRKLTEKDIVRNDLGTPRSKHTRVRTCSFAPTRIQRITAVKRLFISESRASHHRRGPSNRPRVNAAQSIVFCRVVGNSEVGAD